MHAQASPTELKTFVAQDFRLQSGIVLPEIHISYRTVGTLAANSDNVVLVTHGNTSWRRRCVASM